MERPASQRSWQPLWAGNQGKQLGTGKQSCNTFGNPLTATSRNEPVMYKSNTQVRETCV